MNGKRVNPLTINKGDIVATKVAVHRDENDKEIIRITKSGPVKRVDDGCTPETAHIDGVCYDTRFTTIVVPAN